MRDKRATGMPKKLYDNETVKYVNDEAYKLIHIAFQRLCILKWKKTRVSNVPKSIIM